MLYLGLLVAGVILAAIVINRFKANTIDRRHVLLSAVGGAVLIIPQVALSDAENLRLQQVFEESGKTVVVAPAGTSLKEAPPPTDEDQKLMAEVKQELELRRYFVDDATGVDLDKKAGDRPVVQVLGINAALERNAAPR